MNINCSTGVYENIIIIGDLSEPLGDRHAWSETHRRPTYPIGDPTCLWRPIGDQHDCRIQSELKHIKIFKYTYFIYFLLIYLHVRSGMTVSEMSLMGLRSGMLISVGLPVILLLSTRLTAREKRFDQQIQISFHSETLLCFFVVIFWIRNTYKFLNGEY